MDCRTPVCRPRFRFLDVIMTFSKASHPKGLLLDCSPANLCGFFLRNLPGDFGEFFWSPSPRKSSTKNPQKIRGKFGAKFGAIFGTNSREIRGIFVLQLSDLRGCKPGKNFSSEG